MNKTILVTGIGGNVGQGILRNIKRCGYRVKIIGTNTTPVSAGNHLCHVVYTVPFATDHRYITVMRRICDAEKVDLIIPSTDAETYYLALSEHKLPELSTSSAEVALTFYNKLKTWESFHRVGIPFAETVLPSRYKKNFSPYIVKPITGRGSRNIFVNPEHPGRFSDEYVVQRLYKGQEITTGFYVTKQKKLLGQITFTRTLQYGFTQQCEVTFRHDKKVSALIDVMLQNFDIKGSCNMQSIVEQSSGKVIPFEINGRISGTNSIRAQFGFEDVRYTIDEYLYNKTPRTPRVTTGSAVRMMMDIIYPNRHLTEIKNNKDKYFIF